MTAIVRAVMNIIYMSLGREHESVALTGVAQLAEHCPGKQNVISSISSQGTCLGCGTGPLLGPVRDNRLMFLSHIDVSLPLFLPLFPPL